MTDEKPQRRAGDFSDLAEEIFKGIDLTPRTPEEQTAFIESIKNPRKENTETSLRETLENNFPLGTSEQTNVSKIPAK